jgi:hypothetical protein
VNRSFGRAQRHVLAGLGELGAERPGETLTIAEIAVGHAASGVRPTPAEYEAIRRAVWSPYQAGNVEQRREGFRVQPGHGATWRLNVGTVSPRNRPTPDERRTLADLGTTKSQASRWMALARMPEPEYQSLRERIRTGARRTKHRPEHLTPPQRQRHIEPFDALALRIEEALDAILADAEDREKLMVIRRVQNWLEERGDALWSGAGRAGARRLRNADPMTNDAEPTPFSAACHVCRLRGGQMCWWMPVMPVVDEPPRPNGYQKACQADLKRWTIRLSRLIADVYFETEPVLRWLRPIMEWGKTGRHPRQEQTP